MSSGKRLNRCYPKPVGASAVARPKIIAKSLREFCGCFEVARAGAICPRSWASVPASVGNACACGKSRKSGCGCGERSCPNWTGKASWTGTKHSSTGVLLLPKRGRVRRQNQARQGYEVDGGGRRPRYTFGKSTDQRLAGRSQTG